MARPTKWSKALEKTAWEYVDGKWKDEGHAIPSVVGLCNVLGVHRETLYAWSKDEKKEFSYILRVCNQNQELTLLNGSLSNGLNANIAKLVLGKHGYHDKAEVDNKSSDGSMTPTKITRTIIDPKND